VSRWGNPFAVAVLKPLRGGGRSWRVAWSFCGAGRGRQAPADFKPIRCETRHQAHEVASRLFRDWLAAPEQADLLDRARRELVGLSLACWCPLDLPCHGDVLLDLVNRGGEP
jgi:hypothetical protein